MASKTAATRPSNSADRIFAMGILEKYKPKDYDNSRRDVCVEARRLTMIELRQNHTWTLKRIAAVFNFDHTTVFRLLGEHRRVEGIKKGRPFKRDLPPQKKDPRSYKREEFKMPDIPGITRPFNVFAGDHIGWGEL
jgi:hypothetical protein